MHAAGLRRHSRIVAKKMKTTVVYRRYIGRMEKKVETTVDIGLL